MVEKKKVNKSLIYITSVVLLVILALGSIGLAAWAMLKTHLQIGGKVTFNGTGNVLATVSDGKVNYEQTEGVMTGFSMDADYDETANKTILDTWKNLDIVFDEDGNDIPLTFTVTNDSTDKSLLVEMTSRAQSKSNVIMDVMALGQPYEDSVTIAPGKSVEYMVLFSLEDVERPGNLESFSVMLNMRNLKAAELPQPTLEKLAFNILSDTTCEVLAAEVCEGDVIIPEKAVCDDGKTRNVVKVADSGFNDYSDITSVVMPDSITEIGGWAFANTCYMRSITIPNEVVNIGEGAFNCACEMTSVVIGYNVEYIYDYAFDNCCYLKYINIPAHVMDIAVEPAEDGYLLWGCCESLSQIVVDENNVNYSSFDNALFNKDKTTLIRCASTKTSFLIPETVKTIRGYAFGNSDENLTRVEIPEGVENIGYGAFSGCSSLRNIDIPTSVTYIGEYAFNSCSSIKSIKVPEGITSIESNTFRYCNSLIKINLPLTLTSIGSSAFYSCSNLSNIEIPDGVESIGSSAFSYCKNLSNINIPSTVTSIGSSAFRYCSSLTSVEIPSGVTKIEGYTFANCTSLKTVVLPEGLTSIADTAFQGCTSLESINLPGSLGTIPANLFKNLTNLKNVTLGEGITTLTRSAFTGCTNLETINIPRTVSTIPNSMFSGFKNLKNVEIGEGVTTIEVSAFNECRSLTSITIPSSVISIGDSAFTYCYNLAEVQNLSSLDIVKGKTTHGYVAYYAHNVYTNETDKGKFFNIGDYQFYNINDKNYLVTYTGSERNLAFPTLSENCTYEINQGAFSNNKNITSIVIPTCVTSIGDNAFSGCTNLTSITIPSSVSNIGKSAFNRCSSLTSITIPSSVETIGNYAFAQCYKLVEVCNLSNLELVKGSTSNGYVACYAQNIYTDAADKGEFINIGDYKFYISKNGNSLMEYIGNDSNITLPVLSDDRTYEIQASVFYENTQINSVIIPNCVTRIGYQAFYNCTNLTSILIPSSVTVIEEYALYYCIKLTSLTIPESVTVLKTNIVCGCKGLTSITIPSSVASIWMYAFQSCENLNSITFQNTTGTIGISDRAFYGVPTTATINFSGATWTCGSESYSDANPPANIQVLQNKTWTVTKNS